MLLRGGRLGGRGSDAKAIGDALWTLVLGYLDASLAGDSPCHLPASHQQHAAGLTGSSERNMPSRNRPGLMQALLHNLIELHLNLKELDSLLARRVVPVMSPVCALALLIS